MSVTENQIIGENHTGFVKESYTNRELEELLASGRLRKDHPLRRKPDQWGKAEKDGLIVSVIKEEDIDPIKLCEQHGEGEAVLWLIDGVQRISTLDEYRNGGFPLGRELEEPVVVYWRYEFADDRTAQEESDGNYSKKAVKLKYDLRGKSYQDLPVELRERLDQYKMEAVRYVNCSEDEIGYHIRRYNRQTPMNTAQSVMTYMDHVAKEVKRISLSNRFFKDCGTYSTKERNNGTIERIVMESVMGMFHLKDWQKQSKKMGAYLNQNASKEEFEQLDQNLHSLENIVRKHKDLRSLFTSKTSFLWFTLYHLFLKKHKEEELFAEFLEDFQKGKKQSAQGCYTETKDKAIVTKKLKRLERMLHRFLSARQADDEEKNNQTLTMDLVRELVSKKATREDMEQYEEVLADLMADVDPQSPLLEKENHPSLVALVAYSFFQDVDLDNWIVEYAHRNSDYSKDQRQNFFRMKEDFEAFEKPVH